MMEGMEAFNTRRFVMEMRTVSLEAVMEMRTVSLEAERPQLTKKVIVLRGQVGRRPPAVAVGPASSTPTIDTKVIGKPNHCSRDRTRFVCWSVKLQSYMVTLDSRYQQLFAEAEKSTDPILIATRDPQRTAVRSAGHVSTSGSFCKVESCRHHQKTWILWTRDGEIVGSQICFNVRILPCNTASSAGRR